MGSPTGLWVRTSDSGAGTHHLVGGPPARSAREIPTGTERLADAHRRTGWVGKVCPGDPDDFQSQGPEAVLADLLLDQCLSRAVAVFEQAVELDNRVVLGKVEVDSADEAGVVVEHRLQNRTRQAFVVQEDPEPRLAD